MTHNKKLYGQILLGTMGCFLIYVGYKAFTVDDMPLPVITEAQKAALTPGAPTNQVPAPIAPAPIPIAEVTPANPMLKLVNNPNPTGKSPLELTDAQLNTYFDKTVTDLESRTTSPLLKMGLEYIRANQSVRNAVISESKSLNKSMEDVLLGYVGKIVTLK